MGSGCGDAAQDLFTYVMDVFGKPPRLFFSHLAQFATNKEEAAKLHAMGERKGEHYDDFVRHKRSLADALLLFPSARPPLPYLLDMIPTIKPRAYSICSTPRVRSTQHRVSGSKAARSLLTVHATPPRVRRSPSRAL
jgi:sulfite reductase alpha subunit-like flavoprotein